MLLNMHQKLSSQEEKTGFYIEIHNCLLSKKGEAGIYIEKIGYGGMKKLKNN